MFLVLLFNSSFSVKVFFWILKNSKDLLDNLKSRSFSQVSSIKTFDFSTLYPEENLDRK
jgi:hypothetical protein